MRQISTFFSGARPLLNQAYFERDQGNAVQIKSNDTNHKFK